MSHTPGPWEIYDNGDDLYVIGPRNDARCFGTESMWPICTLDWDDEPDRKTAIHANAKLIAAAPDLLAVVQAFHRECLRQNILLGPLVGDAEAALSKATGA
jgi:hypothetical protein